MTKLGKLIFTPMEQYAELVAPSVLGAIQQGLPNVLVAKIDPELADTAAFCEHYDIGLDVSANCVVIEAKRGDRVWYVACMILATTKADVNGVVRKHLDARKVSFAPMDKAVSLTGMEYGGITPIGLPKEWPILVDVAVANAKQVIVGSGIRGSKLLVPGALLAELPNAITMGITKRA